MSRDVVLAVLVLVVCGGLVWAPGLLPARGAAARSERASWLRLWTPVLPAAAALALLVGWALQEPSTTDELLGTTAVFPAVALGVVWTRAAWRALRALAPAEYAAAAVGLLRPRAVVSARLRATLSAGAVAAALTHEEAHVRHHDPLRIWLAQMVTDLQWPFRGANARLRAWLDDLELARDDEARREGARGDDLAEALVGAARLSAPRDSRAAALLGSPADALAARVERLLGPLEAEDPLAPRRARSVVVAIILLVAVWVGFAHGDLVLRALPFVST